MFKDNLKLGRRNLIKTALASSLVITGEAFISATKYPALASIDETIVHTPSGTYSGVKRDGVFIFRGIRYGRDTGSTRFCRPMPATPEPRLFKAWENGPACPQRSASVEIQGEDCLRLNLWTTTTNPKATRPVLVYFHGGAYSTGSGNDPLTDGQILSAAGDVLVVTVTHRLNAFGYLFMGLFDRRFPDSGNVGQLDLILALDWIQTNIVAFGGNPSNVTLIGQSGGGAKIATLMGTPRAAGLFHKVATMSGQQVTASGPLNATKRAMAYFRRISGDIKTIPHQKLVEALDTVDPLLSGQLYFGPVVDGITLLRHPFYPEANPQSNAIPMLMGNTVAETRAFFPATHRLIAGLEWGNLAERLGPELRVDLLPELVVSKYRQWYPAKTPAEIFIAATTDSRSWRGQIIQAEARSRTSNPAFIYQLNFENAAHTDDIGLVFGTKPAMTEAQLDMSQRMMLSFLSFAKNGNPSWPAYDLKDRQTMLFDKTSIVVSNPRQRERELFANAPYIQPGT